MVPHWLTGWRRRRPLTTRTLLQMEAVDCGAASLGSILGYYGRYVSLEELRTACGVSRDGVTAGNLLRAARRYGLVADGVKEELDDLRSTVCPCILFWNFNHFVVLEGFADGVVYLNDPATGPRSVTLAELDDAFTGVVLTFSPGPDFVRGGSEPSLTSALRDRLRGSESAVLYAVLAGLALVLPGIAIPAFSRIFVDQVLVQGLRSWVGPLLLGMALTALLRGGLHWLRSYILLRLSTRLTVVESSRFFWHVLRLPVEFYGQRYAGDVSSRVALNERISGLLSARFSETAIDVVLVIFYAILMPMYDVPLTIVSIGIVAANLAIMWLVAERRINGNRRVLQEAGKFEGSLMGGLSNIETLKATSREGDLFSKLAGHQALLENASQQLQRQSLTLSLVPALLRGLGAAAVLGYGGYLVMQGEMTVGMLVAFQSLQASLLQPVQRLLALGADLQEAVGDISRLDDVLRYPIDPQVVAVVDDASERDVRRQRRERPALTGRIELRGVTFGYSRLARPLVTDFNLTLAPGSRVALVGASGCGKSTLSKLVCRLYEPWDGEILFDGIPSTALDRSVFSASVAFVDQDLTMFEGTIRENLTLWDGTIPESQLIQAAKDALIHDVITKRNGGYDHQVSERGANFSGGQRQRLDIARALCVNPRILVLDEATSALDTVTEEQIDRNIRRRGCTCLIVAHRLSTVRDCDEIIVLDKGVVVQRGTHEQLLGEPDGHYARLLGVRQHDHAA